MTDFSLSDLERIVASRASEDVKASYTRIAIGKGHREMCQEIW